MLTPIKGTTRHMKIANTEWGELLSGSFVWIAEDI